VRGEGVSRPEGFCDSLRGPRQVTVAHTSVISLGPTTSARRHRTLPNSRSSPGSASRAIRKVLVVLTAPRQAAAPKRRCADLDADRRQDRADVPLGWSGKQRGDIRCHPRVAQLGRHAVQSFGGVGEDHEHHLVIRDLHDAEALESFETAHLVGKLSLCSHEQSWVD
jgi:hypothetical protein